MEFTLSLFAAFAALQLATAGLAPLVLPSTTLVRTPQYDSAIVQSDRLGGSFAYSTIEGHSYQAVSPLVQAVKAYHPVEIQYDLNSIPLSYNPPSYYVPNYVFNGQPDNGIRPGNTIGSASSNEVKRPDEDDDTVTVESA